MTTIRLVLVLAASVACAPAAHADAYDDAGTGRRILYGLKAATFNVVPIVSTFANQRCLPGYVVCKVTFAGAGLVASATQIFFGGDVDGARVTARRAVGGDWVVTPRQVATGAGADPYPEPNRTSGDDAYLPDF